MNTQSTFRKWCGFEEDQLLKEVSEGMPIYAIAKVHERSKKAIEIRLQDIAIRMLNNGLTYDEIKEKTSMSEEQVKLRMLQIEQEKKPKNSENSTELQFRHINKDTAIDEIKTNTITILDMLKELADKLKESKN